MLKKITLYFGINTSSYLVLRKVQIEKEEGNLIFVKQISSLEKRQLHLFFKSSNHIHYGAEERRYP